MKKIKIFATLIVLLLPGLGAVAKKNYKLLDKEQYIGVWGTYNYMQDGGLLLYIGENTAMLDDNMCQIFMGEYRIMEDYTGFTWQPAIVFDGYNVSADFCEGKVYDTFIFGIAQGVDILVYKSRIFHKISDTIDKNIRKSISEAEKRLGTIDKSEFEKRNCCIGNYAAGE